MIALCTNVSWEAITSVFWPASRAQQLVCFIWFLLDLTIVAQVWRYGPSQFKPLLLVGPNAFHGPIVFRCIFLCTLVLSFAIVWNMSVVFNDPAAIYSAFGMNMMMSVSFLAMLYSRQSLNGQSIMIAVMKWLGTTFASVAYMMAPRWRGNPLLHVLMVGCFIFDVTYIVALYKFRENRT
jgi:hypothetical protein